MSKALKAKINILKKSQPILRSKYAVKTIGIFGSFARGDDTAKSDIDILVEFNKPVGFFGFLELEHFLQKQLKRKVDLTTKKALKPLIKKGVLKDTVYA